MTCLNGNYKAKRIKTVYNTKTGTKQEYCDEIKYNISKIAKNQYLVKQTNLSSGNITELMFCKSNNGYLSSSDYGIDNMYFNKDNKLIHNWSIPIDSNGDLMNAHAVLCKI